VSTRSWSARAPTATCSRAGRQFPRRPHAAEVEAFYADTAGRAARRVSLGINSRLVKIDGVAVEQVQKVGGRYTEAIERIVAWLEKAADCAENDVQRAALDKLICFYRTGSLEDWDDYNIA
jgi:dipeptidyl-peptidase-3